MNNLRNEGKFIVNGLSDVRKGMKGESTAQATTTQANQGFDVKYDRSVCPVPWWGDTLTLSLDSEEGVEVDGREENTKMLHSIQIKLQRLRLELSEILDRPTMMDSNLGHVSLFLDWQYCYCFFFVSDQLMITSVSIRPSTNH